MITLAERLLDIADQLIRNGANSSALKRRAVSTAYYAVFHALAKTCTNTLLPSVPRNSEAYHRVYRALDHGPLKAAFTVGAGPLRDRDPLKKKIGDAVTQLQSERHRADYMPPAKNFFSPNQAEALVQRARRTVTEIGGLSNRDRVALATCLLFKSRSP